MGLRSPVYIQFDERRIRVLNLKRGTWIEVALAEDANPFNHPRLLVSDAEMAQKVLRDALKQALSKLTDRLMGPPMIVHPLRTLEGGVSPLEEKVLKDILGELGGRKVQVRTGPEPSKEELLTWLDSPEVKMPE